MFLRSGDGLCIGRFRIPLDLDPSTLLSEVVPMLTLPPLRKDEDDESESEMEMGAEVESGGEGEGEDEGTQIEHVGSGSGVAVSAVEHGGTEGETSEDEGDETGTLSESGEDKSETQKGDRKTETVVKTYMAGNGETDTSKGEREAEAAEGAGVGSCATAVTQIDVIQEAGCDSESSVTSEETADGEGEREDGVKRDIEGEGVGQREDGADPEEGGEETTPEESEADILAKLKSIVSLRTQNMTPLPQEIPIGLLQTLASGQNLHMAVVLVAYGCESDVPTYTDLGTALPVPTRQYICSPGPIKCSLDLSSAIMYPITPKNPTRSTPSCTVVNVLSTCRTVLMTLLGDTLVQCISLCDPPEGCLECVCTQGGQYHLVRLQPGAPVAYSTQPGLVNDGVSTDIGGSGEGAPLHSVYGIRHKNHTANWVQVPTKVSHGATLALQKLEKNRDTVVGGIDTLDGSVVIGLVVVGYMSQILRLSCDKGVSLNVACTLRTPLRVTSSVTLSAFGETVLVCQKGKEEATTITMSTGCTCVSAVSALNQKLCPLGTLFTLNSSLHLAVGGATCVQIPLSTGQYAVVGDALLYTEGDSDKKTNKKEKEKETSGVIHMLDLSPFRSATLLRGATDSEVGVSAPDIPWASTGKKTVPFTPTLVCRTSRSYLYVALTESLKVVGVAEFDCYKGEWLDLGQGQIEIPESVSLIPLIHNDATMIGSVVYVCYNDQLLSVDILSKECTVIPLTLIDHPRHGVDSQCIVLPTPTGYRLCRVCPEQLVGDAPVGRQLHYTTAGTTASGACIDGVLSLCNSFSVCCGVCRPIQSHHDASEVSKKCVETPEELAETVRLSHPSRVSVGCMNTRDGLAECTLARYDFKETVIPVLRGAVVTSCTFTNCDMNDCDMSGASVTGCTFTGCAMRDMQTEGATLNSVRMSNCSQSGTLFKGAILTDTHRGLHVVDMRDRDLTSETFTTAEDDTAAWDVSGSRVAGCDLSTSTTLSVAQLGTLSNLVGAYLATRDLTGLDLAGKDASGCVMTGCNLSCADVSGAVLDQVDLTKACLVGVTGLTDTQLQRVYSVVGANLGGLDMRGWDLSDVNVSHCDMLGCQLKGCTLHRGYLTGTTLPEGQGRVGCKIVPAEVV
ncbi:hypothetical protein KIPB_001176 [Kipferlia bialata]|uniref:Uncharacterized protein n=1 Tax=Kipferlia bialata TaxID=797122 RepID=A0A9K3GF06_9EUKA|nr:hypothetical protein KIPB_001176 [Kipferlia bialata]|eukprot:g1176.t1